jgi:hypothetical protein
VEEGCRQLRVDALQQFQCWPKSNTGAGCLRRFDNEEQLIGPAFITLSPITGT